MTYRQNNSLNRKYALIFFVRAQRAREFEEREREAATSKALKRQKEKTENADATKKAAPPVLAAPPNVWAKRSVETREAAPPAETAQEPAAAASTPAPTRYLPPHMRNK